MRTIMRIFNLALLTLMVLGCKAQPISPAQTNAQASNTGTQCRISLVDESYAPDFVVNALALEVPSEGTGYKRAYFSMGCFWGSEALMGSAAGVVATQVGFSGGTLPDPTYSRIGDHVETVEVLYDPNLTDFKSLLRHFWRHHNSRAKPIFRQYASAVFCRDPDELEQGKGERELWQTTSGEGKILTAVLPLDRFYPAGETHQKYYLQQDPKLLDSLPGDTMRLRTVLATKLNSVAGRAGERTELQQDLDNLGIERGAQNILFERALWPKN